MDALIFSDLGFIGGTSGLPIKPAASARAESGGREGHGYPRLVFGVAVLVIMILLACSSRACAAGRRGG